MRRIVWVQVVLVVALMSVLVAGCRSTTSSLSTEPCPVENEVALAGYQGGQIVESFDSLGTELSMPLWFLSGK